jgi:hypothetical protein
LLVVAVVAQPIIRLSVAVVVELAGTEQQLIC